MRNTILKKMIIAILSTLILCLLLSVISYTPKGEQEPNTSYVTFMGLLLLYLIFIAPVFLTVGVLFSLIVELKVKSKFGTILSYVIGGGVIGFLYYMLIVGIQSYSNILSEGIILFTCVGAFSALLFYIIQIVLRPLFYKLTLN